jgi:hypothetical protein
MRVPRFPLLLIPLSLMLLISSAIADWERIDVDADLVDHLFEGQDPPAPGCSEAPMPVVDGNGAVVGFEPSDGRFAFFVDLDEGDAPPADLLIYFAGGGACWDDRTCVGSALESAPTYLPEVTETTQLLDAASDDLLPDPGVGGVLTRVDGSDNPFAAFAKVYIPYCTGDVHIGSADTSYQYPSLPPWTIRHRGFDNLRVVLKWLQEHRLSPRQNLTLAGSSAGGYAALFNFPVIRDALGDGPRYSIIVDSASGVLTDGFLDRAFGPPGAEGIWGAKGNLDPMLQVIVDREPAERLWVEVFRAIGDAYPDSRISQSTAAFDAIQASVLLTMQQVDDDSYDPASAPSEAELFAALLEWSTKARGAMWQTALSVSNYRRYLAAGLGHIHLLDPPAGFETPNYFEEETAGNVRYVDWLEDMLNNRRLFFGTDWRNLSCFPSCFR